MKYLDVALEATTSRQCHQDANELAQLLDIIVTLDPKVYVEIGTLYAGGVWAVQQVVPNAKLYYIDISVDVADHLQQNNVDTTFIHGDSTDPDTVAQIDEQIDFLFIDGEHTYDYVKKDFELYAPLLALDGAVGIHDINHPDHPGIASYWKELRAQYNTTEISHAATLGVGIVWL